MGESISWRCGSRSLIATPPRILRCFQPRVEFSGKSLFPGLDTLILGEVLRFSRIVGQVEEHFLVVRVSYVRPTLAAHHEIGGCVAPPRIIRTPASIRMGLNGSRVLLDPPGTATAWCERCSSRDQATNTFTASASPAALPKPEPATVPLLAISEWEQKVTYKPVLLMRKGHLFARSS